MDDPLLYRIEYGDTGDGMYSVFLITEIPELEDMRARHKCQYILPDEFHDTTIREFLDIPGNEKRNWRYCFNDLERLNHCVKPYELDILRKNGFKLFELKAHNYIRSSYQTIVELETIYYKKELT